MNKYICILPWVHLHVAPDGETFPCGICTAPERKTGNYHNTPSLTALMNTPALKALRRQMLKGDRPETCEKCWHIEEADPRATSMRKYYTLYKLRPFLGLIRETRSDGFIEAPKILSLDVRFSNVCNFKCRMCNPKQSSSLAKEWQKLNLLTHEAQLVTYSSRNKEVIEDILANLDYLTYLEFAGGECLIQEEHYILLEKLIERERTDIELVYSTNLSTLRFRQWHATELWNQFESVDLRVSLDHIGEKGEYIRDGLRWDRFTSNLKVLRRDCPHVKLGLNCVVSIFNILTLNDFINGIKQLVQLTEVPLERLRLSVLHWPFEQSIVNLPAPFKRVAMQKGNELDLPPGLRSSLDGVYRFMMHTPDNPERLAQFFSSCFCFDESRGQALFERFPELLPAYESSDYSATNRS